MTNQAKKLQSDVPTEIFNKFLQTLRDNNFSSEVVAGLQKSFDEKTFSEKALKTVILEGSYCCD